ncbi:hypothetical protein FQA39_LY12824 [Lamprigera yunnana]|nr:hypothetical protein FQA39_LY12824 [Lamprigera yunnana]
MADSKMRIKLKGYDHAIVDASIAKIIQAAESTGAQVRGPIPLPTDKQIITILRAVHKYKDSQIVAIDVQNNIVLVKNPFLSKTKSFVQLKKMQKEDSSTAAELLTRVAAPVEKVEAVEIVEEAVVAPSFEEVVAETVVEESPAEEVVAEPATETNTEA